MKSQMGFWIDKMNTFNLGIAARSLKKIKKMPETSVN